MKKVIIIGGGISGLTAGIYLQHAGFDTTIFEKNKFPGGECTGWKRGDYYIDNCIRWLTDSKDNSLMNQLWKNIGMLGNGVKLYEKESFYSFNMNGKNITFWRDLDRTKKELLEFSPEDADAIDKLVENVKKAECRHVPIKKPSDKMGPMDFMEMASSMRGVPAVEKAYKGMSIKDLADSFKNPVINKAIRVILPEQNKATAFIFSYATLTAGNGDIPMGGSLEASHRIADRYQMLGGDLRLGSQVRNVVIEKNRAKGVILEGGFQMEADYVICATDLDYIFTQLLPNKYMPSFLKEKYKMPDDYILFTSFHLAFAVDEKNIFPPGISFHECKEFSILRSKVNLLKLTCFDYDPSFAPEGKSVIQVQIIQSIEDFEQWKNLRINDPLTYEKRKNEYAKTIQDILGKKFPNIAQKIQLLDTWTPATYSRMCNAYKGAFMAFAPSVNANTKSTPGVIKGLDNVYIANQWLVGSGGLPMAAASGKFAAWRIETREAQY